MQSSIGNWLILSGIVLVLIGIVLKTGLLSWFGTLPGDIHIERDDFRFYFPLASMIIISVAFSLLLAIVRRLF